MIFDLVLFVVVLLVFLYLLNHSAFSNLWTAASAWFGKGSKAALAADPIAVYQQKLDHYAQEMRTATTILEGMLTHLKQLRRQLDSAQENRNRVDARIKQYITTDRPRAEEYAVDLVKYDDIIKDTQVKVVNAEKSYRQQSEKIKHLKDAIIKHRERARDLKSDLELSKSAADIEALNQRLTAFTLEDGLGDIESEIKNQIDNNNSKVEVAAETTVTDIRAEDDARDRAAKVKDVLSQYEVKS